MYHDTKLNIKDNVQRFDADVLECGSYAYTQEHLSARTANARISQSVAQSFDFTGKSVLDLGCGDGAYTVEFAALGVREIVGVDPAAVAIEAGTKRARSLGLDKIVRFEVGNIYEPETYLAGKHYDCIVLRGILHHLPDPARAIAALASFDGTVIVVEPNGNNPVLKLIERFSQYHIEHEERSFSPSLIGKWLDAADFQVEQCSLINMVPFFCPDWMVPPLQVAETAVERIPLVRDIACGQSVILAHSRKG